MNMMHTIKDWTSEHHLSYDARELRQMMGGMVHDPSFWLIIALLAFVALMIVAGYFSIGGGRGGNFPLYPTMGWPYYYPYSP